LRQEGFEYIFGLVGTTNNNIVTDLHGRDDIRFVDTRHEEAAAFMAYGYARASGKPAVCLTTSGPASINLLTGIGLAYKGRAPVVVLAGDVARDYIDRDGNQAFDLVSMFKPVTLLARQINKTERVIESLHTAFRTALSGKHGPVMLDIPRDLLDNQTIESNAMPPQAYRSVNNRVRGDAEAIRTAAALLAQAERPLMLVGGGVVDAEASAEAVALAELLGMALVPACGAEQPSAVRRRSGLARRRRSRRGDAPRRCHSRARVAAQPVVDVVELQHHQAGHPHRAGRHRSGGSRAEFSADGGDRRRCQSGCRAAPRRAAARFR
jgi:thiamine pyrophosphate-dependent acetolactate synthase large subunit-like protein